MYLPLEVSNALRALTEALEAAKRLADRTNRSGS